MGQGSRGWTRAILPGYQGGRGSHGPRHAIMAESREQGRVETRSGRQSCEAMEGIRVLLLPPEPLPTSRNDKLIPLLARHQPNQASICHISAQMLSSAAFSSRSDPLTSEALSASLASLRLNRSQPPFLATLQEILDASHPLLASALKDRSVAANKREEVVAELDRLALDEKERETLERMLGLHGEEKEIEEDVGRDVRSL